MAKKKTRPAKKKRTRPDPVPHRVFIPLMKYPLVALGPGRTEPFDISDAGQTEDGMKVVLKVTPDPELGAATIRDADVLVWIATKLTEAKNKGREVPSVLSFHPRDLLKFIGRRHAGPDRQLLEAALRRLASTQIETNVPKTVTNGKTFRFKLIESFERPEKGKRGPWKIVLPKWLVDLVKNNQILKIDPTYFGMSKFGRRVYLFAKSYAGAKKSYGFWLSQFQPLSGSSDRKSKLRAKLADLAKRKALPGFEIALDGDYVTFKNMHPGPRGRHLSEYTAAMAIADLEGDADPNAGLDEEESIGPEETGIGPDSDGLPWEEDILPAEDGI